MGKRFYVVTRDLHLYLGLFLSPFVFVFAISVFYLVHSAGAKSANSQPERNVRAISADEGLLRLSGREQVDAVRPLLESLGVHGEITFIRKFAAEHRLVVPVVVPGRETTVDLNLAQRTATISARDTGLGEAFVQLHKFPGPHNVAIRGNSAYVRVWRVLADISTYGMLFLTLSGVYLWAVLKAERRVGFALLSLGAVTFTGLIYAVCH